jgi:hypothetical protein
MEAAELLVGNTGNKRKNYSKNAFYDAIKEIKNKNVL